MKFPLLVQGILPFVHQAIVYKTYMAGSKPKKILRNGLNMFELYATAFFI